MPTVEGRIGVSNEYQPFLIDVMSQWDMVFDTSCTYKDDNCTQRPIHANETFISNLPKVDPVEFFNRSANGFEGSG